MSTPSLPIITKWACADTCITAYDGFCERFTFTGIWPATAQCLLSSCSDSDRLAVQETVSEYCNAIGYPNVWGPYMWGASESSDATSTSTPTKSQTPSTLVASTTKAPMVSSTPLSSAIPTPTQSPNDIVATSPAGSIVASTTAPTASAVSSSKSSGLSAGAKAGIGIGAALGVLLLAVGLFFLYQWRKKQKSANFPEGPDHFATPNPSPTEKAFGSDEVIIYTIEDGALKKRNEKRLSIKVL
ncbi:hypothetical protein H072_2179 [Dactylellina haptotyla CBS 200.50]|uniref:Extracellular membrane protein CFEM domain-containing protein n=1 Tax=Dactylellina haptotyla (strain CBS 200.50) TaxID=1284197 RepID=S8ALV9_DACHA|nr:hypothetical protein H072_2179 [Dactylellina haptotyla CBS 200.50]